MRVNALQKCFRILGISIASDYYLKINNNQLLCQGWERFIRFGFIISFHHIPLYNSNRTEWSPIRSGEHRVWLNRGQKLTTRWSQIIVIITTLEKNIVVVVMLYERTGRSYYQKEEKPAKHPNRYFFAALITFLKFAGNLVALRPRFHSYVVSVY